MRNFTFILLFSLGAISQNQHITGEVGQKIDFTYQKKWEYFKLLDTTEVTIIEHFRAKIVCGPVTSTSLTIAKTKNGDIIRLLNICNLTDYDKNQIVKVIPGVEPTKVSMPFTQIKNKETQLYEPSEYDLKILKTTWVSFLNR